MSRRAVLVAVGAACALLVVSGLAAGLATPQTRAHSDLGSDVGFAVSVVAFFVVGALIAWRRERSTIGWLLVAIGLLWSLVLFGSGVSEWGLRTHHLPKAVAEWIDVTSGTWVLALGLTGTQLPLRLPTGEPLSDRWRTFARVAAGLLGLAFLGMLVQPGRVEGVPGSREPLGIEGAEPLGGLFLLVLPCFLASIASLVLRYRRSAAHERAQLRWIALGGVLFLTVYFALLLLPTVAGFTEHSTAGEINTSVSQIGFVFLPVSIGIAVLRHHLYDIDVVINRALVYGALTALLAGAYLLSVLVLQLVLPARSGLAVAVSTLATAALFRPARARVQASVDQRFFRRRYDAARTLERFGTQVRDEVNLDALSDRLRHVIDETVAPAHVSLWLRAPTVSTRRSR